MEPKLSIIAVEARLPNSLGVGPWPTFYGGILPLEICGNFAACLAWVGASFWMLGGGDAGPGNNWHFARLGSTIVTEGSLHMKRPKILLVVQEGTSKKPFPGCVKMV